jgi:hypothetical protein
VQIYLTQRDVQTQPVIFFHMRRTRLWKTCYTFRDTEKLPPIRKVAMMLSWLLAAALLLLTATPARGQSYDRCGLRPQDQFVVLSSRGAGCTTSAERLAHGLRYSSLEVTDESGCRRWRSGDASEFFAWNDPSVPTIVFFHGNQVEPHQAAGEGLLVYRALVRCAADERPIRFVTWSWPSETLGGPLRDVREKAARTRPVAWQTAWVLDQLPADLQISLFGYSYGARIATGAAHLLAGGDLWGLRLDERMNPTRPPMPAVFLAAAVHSHWLGEGQCHGLALNQIDRLFLVNNPLDPAMRFYHLSATSGNPQALGLCGPTYIDAERASRIVEWNASGYVGKNHDLHCYVASPQVMSIAWDYLTFAETPGGTP